MAQQNLCFIAFPIVSLTESSNNSQKLSKETHLFSKDALSALERREIKYLIDSFDFLEGDFFNHFIITPIIAPPTSAFSALFNGKCLANLVVKLVLLLTLASSAMSNREFSASLVIIVEIASIFLFSIYRLIIMLSKLTPWRPSSTNPIVFDP